MESIGTIFKQNFGKLPEIENTQSLSGNISSNKKTKRSRNDGIYKKVGMTTENMNRSQSLQSQISIKRTKLAGLNNELQGKNLKIIKKSDINFYPQNLTSPR